jgi:hypothetical protein
MASPPKDRHAHGSLYWGFHRGVVFSHGSELLDRVGNATKMEGNKFRFLGFPDGDEVPAAEQRGKPQRKQDDHHCGKGKQDTRGQGKNRLKE